jgi:D-Tyr-tRNAtyr deacylase
VSLREATKQANRTAILDAARGVFGAMMDVELVNDGPVTLLVELA